MSAQVVVESLVKQYGVLRALDGLTLSVDAGEWIALMGPSGSGKTTLINILGGLDTPTAGRVVVDGVEVSRLGESELVRYRAEKVGFVTKGDLIWYQAGTRLRPYGYPRAFVPNIAHQHIVVLRKEPSSRR